MDLACVNATPPTFCFLPLCTKMVHSLPLNDAAFPKTRRRVHTLAKPTLWARLGWTPCSDKAFGYASIWASLIGSTGDVHKGSGWLHVAGQFRDVLLELAVFVIATGRAPDIEVLSPVLSTGARGTVPSYGLTQIRRSPSQSC